VPCCSSQQGQEKAEALSSPALPGMSRNSLLNNTKRTGLQHMLGCPACTSCLTQLVCADACVFQTRVLLSGSEGCGQDHLVPALLHALEGLPVHSIGLPALLSDASAR
jgi:hypothetical protein